MNVTVDGVEVGVVPLNDGFVVVLDMDDLPLVAGTRWSASCRRYDVYAIAGKGDGRHAVGSYMHRALLGLGPDDEDVVDHVHGTLLGHDLDLGRATIPVGRVLDNRRANLRRTTHSENVLNRQRARHDSQTQLVGVTCSSERRRWPWRAHLEVQGRRRWTRRVAHAEQAALDRDALAYEAGAVEYAALHFAALQPWRLSPVERLIVGGWLARGASVRQVQGHLARARFRNAEMPPAA